MEILFAAVSAFKSMAVEPSLQIQGKLLTSSREYGSAANALNVTITLKDTAEKVTHEAMGDEWESDVQALSGNNTKSRHNGDKRFPLSTPHIGPTPRSGSKLSDESIWTNECLNEARQLPIHGRERQPPIVGDRPIAQEQANPIGQVGSPNAQAFCIQGEATMLRRGYPSGATASATERPRPAFKIRRGSEKSCTA